MPVTTDWSTDRPSILIMTFTDPWTIPDLIDATTKAHEMTESQPNTVHLIMDASATRGLPSSVIATFLSRKEMTQIPANQGYVFVVAQSSFLHTFLSLAKRVLARYTEKMLIVESMETAFARLETLTLQH